MSTRSSVSTLEEEFSAALPTTEAGRLMADRGYDKEALRHDNCGKIIPRKCENGHIDRRFKLMCANRFCCLTCAESWSRERFEDWEGWFRVFLHIESLGEWSTYIEIEAPCPRDPEVIRDVIGEWTSSLKGASNPRHWDRVVGMKGNNLLFRCIIPDTDSEECRDHWVSIFPGAKLTIRTIHSWQIPYVFKNRLLEVIIPDTVEEQVDQWELFRRMHMFRGVGFHTNEEDFFVEENSPTEKSPEDTSELPPDFHYCQVCHEKLTHRAGIVDAFSPPQTWKWEPIPEKDPPGDT